MLVCVGMVSLVQIIQNEGFEVVLSLSILNWNILVLTSAKPSQNVSLATYNPISVTVRKWLTKARAASSHALRCSRSTDPFSDDPNTIACQTARMGSWSSPTLESITLNPENRMTKNPQCSRPNRSSVATAYPSGKDNAVAIEERNR